MINIYFLIIFLLPAIIFFSLKILKKYLKLQFLLKKVELIFLTTILILFFILTLFLFNKANFILMYKQTFFILFVFYIYTLILIYFKKLEIDFFILLSSMIIILEIFIISFSLDLKFFTLKRVIEDLYIQLIIFYFFISYKFITQLKS